MTHQNDYTFAVELVEKGLAGRLQSQIPIERIEKRESSSQY